MNSESTSVLARELLERERLLETVSAQSPVATNRLADELGTSVSTVNRVVNTFASEGMLERTDDGIVATPTGDALVAETEAFLETVERARSVQPVLSSLADAPAAFDPEWILDANITTVTPKHPNAPLRRYSELFSEADRKRLLGDRFVVPEFGVETAMQAMSEGFECSCVWSEEAIERMVRQYPSVIEWSADQENLEAVVAERVSFDLALFDEHLLVYGFDTNGIMSVLADTEDSAAVEWGTAVFERCFEEGRPVTLR